MVLARQLRLAGVLRVVPGTLPRRKGRQRFHFSEGLHFVRGVFSLHLVRESLVGSEAVIRRSSGRSFFLCQRIGGEHLRCALRTAVFTVRFGFRYAYGIGGVELGM